MVSGTGYCHSPRGNTAQAMGAYKACGKDTHKDSCQHQIAQGPSLPVSALHVLQENADQAFPVGESTLIPLPSQVWRLFAPTAYS